ncbi:MAG: hypothetical protein V4663_13110 [Bacteroidota bacterium]
MRNLIYVLLLTLHLGCKVEQTPDLLSPFIKMELAKQNGIVDISKFDKIKWDKLYLISAYQTSRSFDETVLRYENEIENTGITHSEDFNLILLFNGKELVNFSTVQIRDINFAGAHKEANYKNVPYLKNSAVFRYKTDANGLRFIPTKQI